MFWSQVLIKANYYWELVRKGIKYLKDQNIAFFDSYRFQFINFLT